jgi:transmembrane sensor
MGAERTSKIDEAASEWLMRRDSGNWSAADQCRFDEWLQASTLNRVAYLRLELAWKDAGRLKALGAGVNSDAPPAPGTWNLTPFYEASEQPNIPSKRMPVWRSPRALVASFLLAAIVAGTYFLWPAANAYETPVGGIASVPMTDGSKVTLNTDSRIRVALTDNERRIELEQGEAFFEVAKDPRRPFIVHVDDKRVIAVGTSFSVRRDGANVRVIVTEGKVRVENAAVAPASPRQSEAIGDDEPQPTSSREILLTPGTIARASNAGVLVQTKPLPEAEEQLSWRTGVLVFRNQTLAEASEEFNRYNTRRIVINDPEIAALRIEGNFRATNIDAFARLLEQGYAVSVTQEGDQLILRTR